MKTILESGGRLAEHSAARLMLCSENRLFREGLRHIVTSAKITVVAEVRSLDEAQKALNSGAADADLLVCDADESFAMAPEILQAIVGQFPKLGIFILAEQICQRDLDIAVACGARGFLPKNISAQALQISLSLVALGEDIFTAPASLKGYGGLAHASEPATAELSNLRAPLSGRETQILRCLQEGLPNKTIARDLDMAEATVKVHLKALLRKINADNRTQAAIWSMNNLNPRAETNDEGRRLRSAES